MRFCCGGLNGHGVCGQTQAAKNEGGIGVVFRKVDVFLQTYRGPAQERRVVAMRG